MMCVCLWVYPCSTWSVIRYTIYKYTHKHVCDVRNIWMNLLWLEYHCEWYMKYIYMKRIRKQTKALRESIQYIINTVKYSSEIWVIESFTEGVRPFADYRDFLGLIMYCDIIVSFPYPHSPCYLKKRMFPFFWHVYHFLISVFSPH